MPFFLDGNPTQGEISEAINYLLSNFTQNVSADPATGQVIGPGGDIQYYLYKYMFVKYANSYDGTVGFSNFPTNCSYYGLRNSDSNTESTNPADYIWYKVTPGFGTTYYLYYLTTGGRSIQFQEATSVPNAGWLIDPGTPIDLDITTKTNAVANFVVIRVPNNFAAPTDAECVSAIGRTPLNGDLCTINYNSGLGSIVYKYTTGWAVFQKYITTDIVEAQSLSAFTANLGTITAGSLSAVTVSASDISSGSSPAISGTGMSGSGIHLYNDGRIGIGNSTSNVVWNNSGIYIQGNLQSYNYSSGSSGWQILNNGNAEFNGVVISRQLQIDTGTYTLPSNVNIGNPSDLTLVSTVYVETNTLASAWSGASKTMIALAGFSGTINANSGNISTQPQNIQWGLSCDVIPITRWSGNAKIFLAIKFYGRLANYYQSGGIVTWQLFQVT